MPEHAPEYDTQAELYAILTTTYNLTDTLVQETDYFLCGDISGIQYYLPNDETWGTIMAVDHTTKLAIDTSFYEMDDMEYPDSDYAQVVHDGQLKCKFETE